VLPRGKTFLKLNRWCALECRTNRTVDGPGKVPPTSAVGVFPQPAFRAALATLTLRLTVVDMST
jgi:hypothetical protein